MARGQAAACRPGRPIAASAARSAASGSRASAWTTSSQSPVDAAAPAASWRPRPRAVETTRAPRAAASSRVPSELPPSAMMISWETESADRSCNSRGRVGASSSVGMTIDRSVVSS
jgi:hypothetical protein